MNAVVFTLGCKVNEVESASIMSALEEYGVQCSPKLRRADIYVLNTCAVTREAERKSRQLITRARKFNPNARIFVCGCASQKNAEQFQRAGVDFVCGARDKNAVVAAVLKACLNIEYQPQALPYPKDVRTRAFIKIEDGCNNFCSYCVIPYLRGRVTSRSAEDVICEVNNTPAEEVVLTGINLSAYNGDGGLTALLQQLKGVKKRVRLGSLECRVIDGEFLQACQGLYDFAPQFHLSLQSGSDSVLKAMNRRYTRAEYLEKCKLIYSHFPDAAITTDIIVGFCGESEEDFEESLSIIDEAGLARVHAFAFSPREGTAAFKMQDVDGNVKARRLQALIKRAEESEKNYKNLRLGREYAVVFEDYDGEYTSGYTGGYIKVYVAGEHRGKGTVKLLSLFRDGVLSAAIMQ